MTKKEFEGIDYAFRPESYWDASDPLLAILRNVKGENRRRMILDYAAAGRLDELEPDLLEAEIDEGLRARLGRIHPSFMGGEYLPGYLPGEVEIARVALESTTGDVISLRARPAEGGGIEYRVVDEYDTVFLLPVTASGRPLSLAEIIRQLDECETADSTIGGGLSLGYNHDESAEARREYRHFTSISSAVYPELEEHYEQFYDAWVEEAETAEGGRRPEAEDEAIT